ncbi:MAG: hypothetical protein PGMFKBFP_02870 [Anaerolineales bacterium]|nr:hypothetical protein [Anaerolineales bacterium]
MDPVAGAAERVRRQRFPERRQPPDSGVGIFQLPGLSPGRARRGTDPAFVRGVSRLARAARRRAKLPVGDPGTDAGHHVRRVHPRATAQPETPRSVGPDRLGPNPLRGPRGGDGVGAGRVPPSARRVHRRARNRPRPVHPAHHLPEFDPAVVHPAVRAGAGDLGTRDAVL